MSRLPLGTPSRRRPLHERALRQALVASVRDGCLPAALQDPVVDCDLSPLVERAVRHRVSSALLFALRGLPVSDAASLSLLTAYHARGVARQALCTAETARMADVLGHAGVPWVLFKGAVLAQRYYADPRARTFADVDVLVPPECLDRAVSLLQAGGATLLDKNWDLLCSDLRGQVHLRLPGGTPLDLHWHLVNRACARRTLSVDTDRAFADAQEVVLGQQAVMTLDPVTTLTHLCLHAGLSGGDRLSWLCDIDRCVRAQQHDWDGVVRLATAWRARLLVGIMLGRAEAVLGTPLPPALVRALVPRRATSVVHAADRLWPVPALEGRYSPLHVLTASSRDRGWDRLAWTGAHRSASLGLVTLAARRGRVTPDGETPSPEFATPTGTPEAFFALLPSIAADGSARA